MNIYVGQNTKNVEDFIEQIRERIIAAANNWKEIAVAFGEAKEMYGFDSDAFRQLCIATKFSKSKASKLATIATSERLKKYERELAAAQSWTVMYEITTLNEEQFDRLLKNRSDKVTDVGKAEIISMGMVKTARRDPSTRSSMRAYATVYVDVDALRSQMMDGESIASLEEALRNIQISVPYVKVEKTNIEGKEQEAYFATLNRAFVIERRKSFIEAVDKKLKDKKKATWESKAQHEKRVLGQSRASTIEQFSSEPEETYRMVTDDYDAAVFWDKAQDRLSKNLASIVSRVKERGDAFVHANAAIKEIKEDEEARIAEEEAIKNRGSGTLFRYKTFNREAFKDFK